MTNQELQSLKNKFDIIGNDPALNRALEIEVDDEASKNLKQGVEMVAKD